jgi:predicted RecB family nuclease
VGKGELLDARDVAQCPHRVALERRGPQEPAPLVANVAGERRRKESAEHVANTLARIQLAHPDAHVAISMADTVDAVQAGVGLILRPHLPDDREGGRRATAHALIRTGRFSGRTGYAPLLIRHIEVVTPQSTRRLREGSLDRLAPGDATWTDGVGTRRTATVTRNGLALAHIIRTLQALDWHDASLRGALIDRNARVWWFDFATLDGVAWTLAEYDLRWQQRRQLLREVAAWDGAEDTYPTTPYWHRECPDCPFADGCESRLEATDDVSLTRFTSFTQQIALREAGINSRRALSALDPVIARHSRGQVLNLTGDVPPTLVLGRQVEKLDELIYRARVTVNGAPLRNVSPERMGCPTADVEVDVDMESDGLRTYLWGATVRCTRPDLGIASGHTSFVNWDPLTDEVEREVFRRFWTFFDGLRQRATAQGATFAGYCFWAQAEDGAMSRAAEGQADLEIALATFREGRGTHWIDLHEVAKGQIQTEGAFGLKTLASFAGFSWRDEHPNGEASMSWYDDAVGGDAVLAEEQRARLLAYNEDDCRATAALRDWLNGPAQALRHRDDPEGPWLVAR